MQKLLCLLLALPFSAAPEALSIYLVTKPKSWLKLVGADTFYKFFEPFTPTADAKYPVEALSSLLSAKDFSIYEPFISIQIQIFGKRLNFNILLKFD